MAIYKVKGGERLSGTYVVSGAKNAGPKLIIATMLSNKESVLKNIPRISDTEKIMSAIRQMGGEAVWTGEHEVTANCANLNTSDVPAIVLSARHAVLFIGATLARLGRVSIAKIGGDKIGKRPIDRLLSGLESLGATVNQSDEKLEITMPDRPMPREFTFSKNTHTGTESLILGSIFNLDTVTIRNAALEPEIDNLIELLNKMGAKVARTEHRVIKVTGVPKLLGAATATSMYDRLEAATAITLAVLNNGDISVAYDERPMVADFEEVLNQMGVVLRWEEGLVSIQSMPEHLNPVKIKTSVYPGFITDWQPIVLLLLAHCAEGRSEVWELIYEQRWSALEELGKMGVKYELFQPEGLGINDYNFNAAEYNPKDPYGAYVWGPTKLQAKELNSADVRAGVSVLLASLFAKGESTINDPADHIDRGYEDIVGKLTKLGAKIVRQ